MSRSKPPQSVPPLISHHRLHQPNLGSALSSFDLEEDRLEKAERAVRTAAAAWKAADVSPRPAEWRELFLKVDLLCSEMSDRAKELSSLFELVSEDPTNWIRFQEYAEQSPVGYLSELRTWLSAMGLRAQGAAEDAGKSVSPGRPLESTDDLFEVELLTIFHRAGGMLLESPENERDGGLTPLGDGERFVFEMAKVFDIPLRPGLRDRLNGHRRRLLSEELNGSE